jgi:Mg-chelatase subunit ChlD
VWSSPITFERPWFLILIPITLFAVWLFDKYSTAAVNRITRRQVYIIRSVTIFLVVLCAAGITWQRRTDHLTTIFVVDMSDSVPMDERQATLRFIDKSLNGQRSHDRVGVVVFGAEPFVEFPPSDSLQVNQIRASVPGGSTDIQAGLEAAAGAMTSDTAKRIVLCTDGLENNGEALSTITSLRNQGIQVDIAPTMLGGSKDVEAMVDRVVVPGRADVNSPIRVRIVLSSTAQQPAKLIISRDGRQIGLQNIRMIAGKSAYYFDDKISSAGIHNYTAAIQPTLDTHYQNNSASSGIMVSGIPHVLIVRNANERLPTALPAALRAQGISVSVLPPSEAPTTAAGLSGYDSVILSDVAAGDLTSDQMSSLEAANENFGVGLGMLGGVDSFGSGGYAGTPIEATLPVLMTPKNKNRIPAADVVIVLDASGSMGAEEGGVEKVEIAARAALNLLDALQPKDRVAVLAVTETATIVMPLTSPSEAGAFIPAIKSVAAGGGGIDCRNGLEAAYELLQTSNASIKHVIICPDTTDSEQQDGCSALAANMYKTSKISTSVCGIGDWHDNDVPFQRALALAGHGQLYVANEASTLPMFFQRDVKNVEQKLYMEGLFNVRQLAGDAVTDTSASYPQILGYNLVDPKPDATVPMTLSGHNDPLFAYWHHGIGKSFVFTSDDDAHWALDWITWKDFPAFWAHVVRWSMPGGEDQSFQTEVSDIKGDGHVVVDAFNTAGYSTNAHFRVSIAGPDGSVKQRDLTESSPGRYETRFSADNIGSYVLQIRNQETLGYQTNTVTTPYSPEYADLRPDTEMLGVLSNRTGGLFLNRPSQVFRRGLPMILGSENLANPLLLIACLLFLLDVAWRRFGWRVGKQTAELAGERIRTGAIVAAGSIKHTIIKPNRSVFDSQPASKQAKAADADLLKVRTASRADLDDDDPFPYVASLPERKHRGSKDSSMKEKQ